MLKSTRLDVRLRSATFRVPQRRGCELNRLGAGIPVSWTCRCWCVFIPSASPQSAAVLILYQSRLVWPEPKGILSTKTYGYVSCLGHTPNARSCNYVAYLLYSTTRGSRILPNMWIRALWIFRTVDRHSGAMRTVSGRHSGTGIDNARIRIQK